MRGIGRREQARVAARVRALLTEQAVGTPAPAAGAAPGSAEAGGEPSGDYESGPLQWVRDDGPASGEPAAAEQAAASESGRAGTGGAHAARRAGARRWRLDPGRPAALVLGAAALVAAVVAGGWVLASKPHAVALAGPSGTPVAASSGGPSGSPLGSAPAPASGSGCATGATAIVVVDVAGKVARPGVYHLPGGSRVVDAVQAAGGALPGVSLADLNLAAPLADGAQVAVGIPAAAGAPASGGASGGPGATSGPINLNAATLEQLETLPGIGPVLGQQILDWRTQHGGFSSVEQLKEVSGIGDARFAELQPLVTV